MTKYCSERDYKMYEEKSFLIVEFVKDGKSEIAPKSWIFQNEKEKLWSYWPPVTTPSYKVNSLIQKCAVPGTDWDTFEISRILGSAGKFHYIQ